MRPACGELSQALVILKACAQTGTNTQHVNLWYTVCVTVWVNLSVSAFNTCVCVCVCVCVHCAQQADGGVTCVCSLALGIKNTAGIGAEKRTSPLLLSSSPHSHPSSQSNIWSPPLSTLSRFGHEWAC